MKRHFRFFAIVGALAASSACSSSDPGRGGSTEAGAFPFSGPSCMGGPPGYSRNPACGQCEINACSSEYGCVTTDCSDTFTCACACPANDINVGSPCENKCPISAACQTCINTVRTCSANADVGTCSSVCK